MSFDTFFSSQALQTGQSNTPGRSGAAANPGLRQNRNFFDLILARLIENTKKTDENTEGGNGHELLQSNNPALSKEPKLDIAQLLGASEEITKHGGQDAETFALDTQDQIIETLLLNQQAFDRQLEINTDIKNLITEKISEGGKPQTHTLLENLLSRGGAEETNPTRRALLNILNAFKKLAAEDSPAATVINLTPEQIAQLQEQLAQNAQTSDKDGILTGNILNGFIKLLPPQGRAGLSLKQNTTPVTAAHPVIGDQTQAGGLKHLQDISSRLNGLTVGEENLFKAEDLSGTKNFKDIIKQLAADKNAASITGKGNSAPTTTPNLSYLQGWPFSLTGSFLTPAAWSEGILEELGLHNSGLPGTSPSSLTNPVTNAQSAGHAHPATHMVAATLQKQASTGNTNNILLQLDPPDLGKVEVKLEFRENKTIKASMLIEKPETYLMLQRDAHVLERTLQEIGLDGESALDFELAAHDHDFGSNGGQNGNRNGGGQGKNGESENNIIETTMRWYVDPQTGLARYDLLV